jgi:PAS domain S-box-containing protein
MAKTSVHVIEDLVQQLRERLAELEAENAGLRQLEATVQRNSNVIKAVLRKSREGFLLVTPELTILRIVHSMLGNTNDGLVGQSMLTKTHPDDQGRVMEAFSRLLSDPSQSVTVEYRVSDAQGRWCWLEVELTDMLDDPDVQAIVLNSRDISERKRCEELIQQFNPQ